MTITPLPDSLDQLLVEASPARTPGLHLSQIIRSILQALEPGKYHDGPVDPLYTEPGFSFERVLETAFSARRIDIVRPGEVTCDGVICSPDGLSFDDDGTVWLEEFKCTEIGMPAKPELLASEGKYLKYLWQIASYCHALNTRHSRLRVLWLRGDYKKVRRAYSVYEIVWDEGETERIWQEVIVKHARARGWLTQTPKGLAVANSLPKERT